MNKTILLLIIVICQFFGTSLWFSSNAVLAELAKAHHLNVDNLLANLTIATQLGFIVGSLLYALLNLADRYKANWVFSISVIIASLCNAGLVLSNLNFETIYTFRFLTGFFLAGVYPVGMKIAAFHFPTRVGKALGVLVGALVLGTAFPHLMYALQLDLPWFYVIITSSILAFSGGLLMFFLDTPAQKTFNKVDIKVIPQLFKKEKFRQSAMGYFGHMWELYAFWAFVPVLILAYTKTHQLSWNTSLINFIVIAIGAISCTVLGKWSIKKGALPLAKLSLIVSGICCLLVPFSLYMPLPVFMAYVLIWGFFVVSDSPLLSTLVNQHSIKAYNGTALTISTSIGFSITIVSMFVINQLLNYFPIQQVLLILGIGPLVGLWQIKPKY